jgi:hypothetical protein
MESLVTFMVLLIASAAVTWLKKRAQDNDERGRTGQEPDTLRPVNQPGQPPATTPRPKPKPIRWEEELRRMLEGEFSSGLPPSRPPLAEVVEPPRPVSAAPPPPLIARVPAADPMGSLPVPEFTEVAQRELAPMRESGQAYTRGSQLDEAASERVRKAAPEPAVQASVVVRQRAAREAGEAAALFKNARAARQAMIASIILRPPKALEE